MIHLARHVDDWPISGREIAEKTGIPRKYLAAVLGDLTRAGLLSSSPGSGGAGSNQAGTVINGSAKSVHIQSS